MNRGIRKVKLSRLLLPLVLFLFSFLLPKSTYAGGSYTCAWKTNPLNPTTFSCQRETNTCSGGSVMGDCSIHVTQGACTSGNPRNCLTVAPTPTNVPSGQCVSRGACTNNCGTDSLLCNFGAYPSACGKSCCKEPNHCLNDFGKCIDHVAGNPCESSALFPNHRVYCPNHLGSNKCCIDGAACVEYITGANPGLVGAGNVVAACAAGGHTGVNSALGCIPTDSLEAFGGWLFSWAIYIIGAIAFLLLSYAAYQIITSSGDSKKMQAGQELITAVLSGLLFVILSMFLLRLIGFDILRLPQFIK